MCLGVPGRVSAWLDRDPLFARANIEFDGIQRECHMACVPEAEIGDYVIIHAGVAICLVDQAEARRVFDELNRLNLLAELETDVVTGATPIESKRDEP
ncbi:MAG: HypC/HybG/HupF family hydrogenase formation chaperone [Planctomycetota bacterium]|nr:HypC/HybG/HupF family hydrogenase formation chaperone [Planctomycetota bacterium]